MLDAALEHLIRGIVNHPDDVRVESHQDRNTEVLKISVNPDDLGRVIGRGGRTAKALRVLAKALADGRRVRVDVLD